MQGEKGVKEDINKAIESLERGSMQGDPISTRKLATIYEKGIKKKIKPNILKSVDYYKLAHKMGDLYSSRQLGIIYESLKIMEKSIFYYQNASKRGDLYSSRQLGIIFEKGLGVDVDIPKSISYYLSASKKGDLYSLNALGSLYLNGVDGVLKKDLEKSQQFFKMASSDSLKELKVEEAQKVDDQIEIEEQK